jgi:lambda family phage portal protein
VGIRSWWKGLRAPAPPPMVRGVGAQATWSAQRASGWLAAQPSRLLADLPGGYAAAPNRDIRAGLATLRNRSRWLAQNDGYTQGFLKMLRRNVVGPDGFRLQMRVPMDRDPATQDNDANGRIERSFAAWSRRGSCDVTGRLSFTASMQAATVALARDGEVFIRLHRSGRFNRFGFALEMLDPSQVDEKVNGRVDGMADGHVARMGVELDPFGRPAAYWMKRIVPNDDPAAAGAATSRTVRVPAAEILHLFMPEWPHQARGVPWISPGIRTLAMLDGYGEAELVAARVSAGKMGFYKIDADAEVDGDLDDAGRLVQAAEAGSFELLPKGVEFQGFDPQHPNSAFKDFVASALRPAAASVGLSFNAFANNADGMNYSALRATELEDRDEFRTVQGLLIEGLAQPIFSAWLVEALMSNQVEGLPYTKAAKFDRPEFAGRGWQWVDPQNEVGALEKEIALGINSRRNIAAKRGDDLDKIRADLAQEKTDFAGLLGTTDATPAAQPAPEPPKPEPARDTPVHINVAVDARQGSAQRKVRVMRNEDGSLSGHITEEPSA